MKLQKCKKLKDKIILIILIILLMNFIMPVHSQASGFVNSVGGILLDPILSLFQTLGDSALAVLQVFMYDNGPEVNFWSNPSEIFMIPRVDSGEMQALFEEYGLALTPEEEAEEPDEVIDTSDFNHVDILSWITPSGLISNLGGLLTNGYPPTYGIPAIKYTPEAIFGNKVPALDVNFINPTDWEQNDMNQRSIALALHNTIASWYVALRNLAIVVLLSVLLYVGIRMVISSSTSDKSKYKKMLFDWVVALCLLFFLHYIMSFILSMTAIITEGIDSSSSQIIVQVLDTGTGNYKFKTNLTGLVRFQTQYEAASSSLIFTIFYLAVVFFTFKFTWTYVKRAITMAFLTLMAPLIAITYPIDRISDGKAQAFSIWIREFIFNALLQPFHLIIYTIFLGGASEIAVTNPIFAILFLAFITPAENLLRKMFGFEKSNTAGAISAAAGAFGGAAIFNHMKDLVYKGAKVAGAKGGNSGNVRTKKPIEQKAPSISEAFGNNSSQNNNRQTNRNANARNTNTSKSAAVAKYESEGFGQNANGEYFNPYIDDYDPNYNPNNDPSYNGGQPNLNNNVQPQRVSQSTQARNDRLNRRTWTQDDTRGMGTWMMDNLKNTGLGRRAVRYARKADESIHNMAERISRPFSRGINHIPKPIRNTVRGIASVAGRAGKVALKGAGMATMAGVGLTVGAALGITEGQDDVLQYGAGGAALGPIGIPALGRGISNFGSNMADTYRQAAYGTNAALLVRQAKEWTSSQENKEALEQTFMDLNDGRRPSSSEMKTFMDAGAVYYNSGITETKDIQKSLKLEKEIKDRLAEENVPVDNIDEMARQQSIVISKLAGEYSKADLRDDKKVDSLRKDIVKQLQNGGTESKQSIEEANNIISMIKKHKGVSSE